MSLLRDIAKFDVKVLRRHHHHHGISTNAANSVEADVIFLLSTRNAAAKPKLQLTADDIIRFFSVTKALEKNCIIKAAPTWMLQPLFSPFNYADKLDT